MSSGRSAGRKSLRGKFLEDEDMHLLDHPTNTFFLTGNEAHSSPSPTVPALALVATSQRYVLISVQSAPEFPKLTISIDGTLPHRLNRLPPLRIRTLPDNARDPRRFPAQASGLRGGHAEEEAGLGVSFTV
jgi:hypothetical protein